MRRRASLLAVLCLFACAPAPDKPGAEPPIEPIAAWLEGDWIAVGDDCRGPGVIRYGANGRWSAHASWGSWSLSGRQITILITRMGADSPDPQFAVAPARRHRLTIGQASASRFLAAEKNREPVPYLRCP